MASGLFSSFLAAIQASLSVLLVIFYGALAAKFKLLDSENGKRISKICVRMFLPALLLVKIGSELHPGSAHRYLIILIWAFICHIVSFLIGIAAHLLLGLPDWITAAIMFNNTTSYPLLLIQSLDETGILRNLIVQDETTTAAMERAKSYFLVFSTISSCLTFAVGPRLMDSELPIEDDDQKSVAGEGEREEDENDDVESVNEEAVVNDETQFLIPNPAALRRRRSSVVSMTFFPSKPKFTTDRRRVFYIPRPKWRNLSPRTQWWLLFFYDFLNAPLLGALLGTFIGFITPLHRAFFSNTSEGGIFTAWLTESWKTIGRLFVPLPLIVAGVSLYASYQESKRGGNTNARLPWRPMLFILLIRFVFWPVLSIGSIYAIAKNQGRGGLLGDDPMLWFAMMLMPTGPPAFKLITMVQVSDAGVEEERRISKILTVSYIVSPVLAFTVVGALRASQSIIGR